MSGVRDQCESAPTGASLRVRGIRDQCESAGTGASLRVRGVRDRCKLAGTGGSLRVSGVRHQCKSASLQLLEQVYEFCFRVYFNTWLTTTGELYRL